MNADELAMTPASRGAASQNLAAGMLDRHGDALYSYAMARLRSPHLAEDAVQETLLAAIGQAARADFALRSSEQAWLVGILKHKIIDQIRRMSREAREPQDTQQPEWESFFDSRGRWHNKPQSWAVLNGEDPHQMLERAEIRAILDGCLSAMPRRLARLFMLKEADGADSDELCKVFEISPAHLWTLMHRARTRLRECLESHGIGRSAAKAGRS